VTGLPWWGTVIGSVIALRVLTAPLAIIAMKASHKMVEVGVCAGDVIVLSALISCSWTAVFI
jgi:hypothetical protein